MAFSFRGLVGCALLVIAIPHTTCSGEEPPIQVWISTEDLAHRLSPLPETAIRYPAAGGEASPADGPSIRILEDETYQSIVGLGSSLEHTTCYNLSQLSDSARREVVKKLVDADDGIGMNLMRICIGTPDFTGEDWYSYDDPPGGKPDPELEHFSIAKDRDYVLPVLKMALKENPDLWFFASPWSPPG